MISAMENSLVKPGEHTEKYPAVFCDLGMIDYGLSLDLQEDVRQCVIDDGNIPGVLFTLEHPPTYTHGRLAEGSNLLLGSEALLKRGIRIHQVDRGGDFTYHGPGQLVAYPIFDLKRIGLNVRNYCHALEEVVIRVLRGFDIEAGRQPKYMGVWVGEKKICAIGVGIRKWVSKHGFAFNINTDMSYFEGIIPCGITEYEVTSLRNLQGGEQQDPKLVLDMMKDAFVEVFNLELKDVTRKELEAYHARG